VTLPGRRYVYDPDAARLSGSWRWVYASPSPNPGRLPVQFDRCLVPSDMANLSPAQRLTASLVRQVESHRPNLEAMSGRDAATDYVLQD
jgi:hypothetical protein